VTQRRRIDTLTVILVTALMGNIDTLIHIHGATEVTLIITPMVTRFRRTGTVITILITTPDLIIGVRESTHSTRPTMKVGTRSIKNSCHNRHRYD
jgi:hypothetical protein